MILTFGIPAVLFIAVIVILQLSRIRDRTFTDYAVGNRSFGAGYQAMSFLNTWFPGAVFTAFGGMAASVGVLSFYCLSYSLLTVVVMYVMARPAWIWGKTFDLRTQPDLLALRYGSRHIRAVTAVAGILSGLPWLILGMQALGTLFHYMSLGALDYSQSVVLGVLVIGLRQVWTIRLGMRGVVISDFAQGIVAYIGGTVMLAGLIAWLVLSRGITFDTLDVRMFTIPGPGSKEGSLYLFSLVLTGAVGGWCWPVIFVRLFTARGVSSIKASAAIASPIALVFASALLIFGMLGSKIHGVSSNPSDVWFIVSEVAWGEWGLGLAGAVILAASMGNIDGHIQATGAQIANDLFANYAKFSQTQLIVIAKSGMVALTLLSAWLACLSLPALFTLAILAYQGIVQLAVPQFLGLFWKRGNKHGAVAGMIAGFAVAIALEIVSPGSVSWAWGLTSGVIGLAVNLGIYVAAALMLSQSAAERRRVDDLFAHLGERPSTWRIEEIREPA